MFIQDPDPALLETRIRNPAEYSRTIILCKILLKIWQRLNTDDLGTMKGAIEKMEGIKRERKNIFYYYFFINPRSMGGDYLSHAA